MQPLAPRLRLLVVAAVHQRQQRQRCVAQPAEAVVPVSHAAKLLRQRRGRRGDDSAGRPIGQRLQRDQGTQHAVGAISLVLAFLRPLGPERLGLLERRVEIERVGWRQMRWPVGHDKGHRFSGCDGEFADMFHVPADEADRRAQHHHVRPGDGAKRFVLQFRDPGNDGAVTEPQQHLGAHVHAAALADNKAYDVRMRATRRHEVDQRCGAVTVFEPRFQDQRVVAIAPRDAGFRIARADQPAAMLGACQGARRSRHRNRTAASTASRSSHPCRRGRPPRNRRSARNPRCAMPWRPNGRIR